MAPENMCSCPDPGNNHSHLSPLFHCMSDNMHTCVIATLTWQDNHEGVLGDGDGDDLANALLGHILRSGDSFTPPKKEQIKTGQDPLFSFLTPNIP